MSRYTEEGGEVSGMKVKCQSYMRPEDKPYILSLDDALELCNDCEPHEQINRTEFESLLLTGRTVTNNGFEFTKGD